MKKTVAVISAAVLLVLCLSSCGYHLSIEKDTEPETTTAFQQETYPVVTAPPVTEATTAFEEDTSPGLVVDSSYEMMSMTKEDVMKLYTSCMNDVKTLAPGFVKTETQNTVDVVAGSGNTQLANSILNLVGNSILNGSDGNYRSTVYKGNKTAVRDMFPLFGEETGCTLTDYSIIKSAVCYRSDSNYKIVIQVNDTLNPDTTSEFSKIMDPADVSSIRNGIPTYLVVLNYKSYQFDMNYTGCEITCVIDKKTSRMESLSHKMITNVSIDINLDLIVLQTQAIKCSGKIIDHVDYSDFDW